MIAALLLCSTALAQASGEPQTAAPAQAVSKAPPTSPIAGLAGFRSRSRIELGAPDEQVLELEAFYVFPERVRWSLLREGAAATERQLLYRFGADYWSIAPGKAVSRPLGPDAEAAAARAHMELRRAAMLWPDGFEWRGEGDTRKAATAVELLAPDRTQPAPVVFLARLDSSGRPIEMHVLAGREPDGEPSDTGLALLDITWRQQGERWWPHSFELAGYGEHDWLETVESVDTSVLALDDFFVPPDRRAETAGAASTQPQVVTLPSAVQSRRELPADTSWDQALATAERWIATEAPRLAGLGAKLQEGIVLELAADSGAPTAVLLRLAVPVEPLPEGWERVPERPAVSVRRSGAGQVSRGALERLRLAVPKDGQPGTPYARLVTRSSGEATLQLIVPFERSR